MINLCGVDFSGADLSQANMIACWLDGAIVRGTALRDPYLGHCQLRRPNRSPAAINRCA